MVSVHIKRMLPGKPHTLQAFRSGSKTPPQCRQNFVWIAEAVSQDGQTIVDSSVKVAQFVQNTNTSVDVCSASCVV